jgi:lipopolysaccharide transport system permease protein
MQIKNLWPYRWLLLNFLSREIKSRYVGSVSGIFWALLHPLALLAVYAVVFTAIFKVKFPELEDHSFILFVAVGLWPWLCFQEGAQRGALAVQNGGGLIKKVAFPA